ncbi:hypothetical protein Bca4012_079848 [Brassica carinata]|uniref:Uncharacterized protein n=1 Tax=Brassica oleracea var. oleracea TaxID=109376 RepID=A0A0D3DEM5_BRAOL
MTNSDVYSFGVVPYEIITGRRTIIERMKHLAEKILVKWVKLYHVEETRIQKTKRERESLLSRVSPTKPPLNPNSINSKLLFAVAAGVSSPVTAGFVSVLSAPPQPFASSSRLSSLCVCLGSMGLSVETN